MKIVRSRRLARLAACAVLVFGVAGTAGVRRARLGAEEQTRQGVPVRYLRSMYLPDEETCFLLYEAESAEAPRRAAALAAMAFERVSEVIGDTLTADNCEGA
jgi:hypothetical protein